MHSVAECFCLQWMVVFAASVAGCRLLVQIVPGYTQVPGQVFQLGTIARQGHRQAGTLAGRVALQLTEQATGDAAHAGHFADTEMADLPAIRFTQQDGGTQQAGVEACAHHAAMGQVVLQQGVGIGIGGQQSVRRVGVDFVQIGLVLTAGQLNMLQIYRHAVLL